MVLDENRSEKRTDSSCLNIDPAEFFVTGCNKSLPEQRFYANIGKAHIEGFFKRGTKKRLYVVFDGSKTRNGGKDLVPLPTFSRWSWAFLSEASFLCLEDPMYYSYDQCKLGWFYGTEDEDYRYDCAQCILKITKLLGLKNENVVLYGASGGGTAAIGTSKYIKGCSVVAINPQLFFENYPDVKQFEISTGICPYYVGGRRQVWPE